MADGILMKSGSGGSLDPDVMTTSPEHVLAGKIFGGAGSDEPQIGTMPNNGGVSRELNGGEAYTIPAGYHNGAGKVTANSLSGQTSGTASATHILSGQTAWVNGNRLTGSMPNNGNVYQSLAVNGSYTIPAGYHAGGGRISQSIATQGAQTITPGSAAKTIAANRYLTGVQTIAGDGNLSAGNIKKGVTIFGITGTHSGYVAEPADLYREGSLGLAKGFTQHDESGVQNSSGHLEMQAACMVLDYGFLVHTNSIDVSGYSAIHIRFARIPLYNGGYEARTYISASMLGNKTDNITGYLTQSIAGPEVAEMSINVANINRHIFFHFGISTRPLYVYRIWLE